MWWWWNNDDGEDRISVLPLDIIHRILSFVKIQEAIRTCILSRRWRYVWKSLPYLTFNYAGDDKFIAFVNEVFYLREVSSHIQTFRLNFVKDQGPFTRKWIETALETNNDLQELFIDGDGDIKYQLPLEKIFTSKSLRILEVIYDSNFPKQLDIPNSISLPRLEKLVLLGVRLEYYDLKNILLNCHVLELLSIKRCVLSQNHLEISTLNLKHLVMSFCKYVDVLNEHKCTIKIIAPNLLSFRWSSPQLDSTYCYSETKLSLEIQITCESLKIFKLKSSDSVFRIPDDDSMFLPKLKKLVIHDVKLEGGGGFSALKSIFSRCPLLESINLSYCEFDDNVLDICSLQLKHLVILYIGKPKSIKLYAPNLISISCRYFKWKCFDIEGTFSNLVRADIDVAAVEEFQFEWGYKKPDIDDEMRKLYLPQIVKLLGAFHSVKDLKLSPVFVTLLSEAPELLENLLEFRNLTHLNLSIWLLRDSINVIAKLLELSPNVESFTMTTFSKYGDNGLQPMENALQRCTLFHLTEVAIYGSRFKSSCEKFYGYDHLMFLRPLLKKANNLRSVKLKLSGEVNFERLKETNRFLQDFPRVSPNVTFFL